MNKKELSLLERAYAAEIDSALTKSGIHVMQTRSTKLADKLVEDGWLRHASCRISGCTISGYELTEAGRLAYCLSCY